MSENGDSKEPLLDIRGMEVHFETRRGIARAVNEVDLTLYKGERFGLVGESGSGKTTLILALLRMIKTPGFIAGGSATLDDGTDLLKLNREDVRRARLKRVAMVPQGAMNSLNPVMRIGEQLMLTMREHAGDGEIPDRDTQRKQIEELLDRVGLKHEVARLYPHELSGGMKQRVCIAQAISLNPQLILADEPTSALDPEMINEVLDVMTELATSGMTMICVTHEMGFARKMANRIIFMDEGQIVEENDPINFFKNPESERLQLFLSQILTHDE